MGIVAQASQLLIAAGHDFAQVGRLRRLSHAALRRPVRPGDLLAIRCERHAERLRALARELRQAPVESATRGRDE